MNVLVLDEPTNHLDIPTKEVLKKAIQAFDGTAIIVSHDRDFLDGLVDKTYEFTHHTVVEHLGGIYQFLEDKNPLLPNSKPSVWSQRLAKMNPAIQPRNKDGANTPPQPPAPLVAVVANTFSSNTNPR